MGFLSELRQQLAAQIPTSTQLEQVRWLRPVAPRLTAYELWHARPEPMARGVAIGLFWAFAVPVAQIVFAAAHCVWWRANIPVAAAITFITNPLTLGFWLWLAYQAGSLMVGNGSAPQIVTDQGVVALVQSLGWPTVVGLATFALGGAALGYLAVRVGSRMWFHWRYARRSLRRSRNSAPT